MKSSIVPAAVMAAALIGWGAWCPPVALADEAPAGVPDYGGLPEGLGREAVYFNCTACHSIKQVTQQRMPREDWDALLDTMVEKNGMHPMEPWARQQILSYLDTHYGVDEGIYQDLPAGPGRDLVFGLCQACHSLAIVKQQGLDRDSWVETMEWMVEEQGMPRLDDESWDLMIDYLTTHYGRN